MWKTDDLQFWYIEKNKLATLQPKNADKTVKQSWGYVRYKPSLVFTPSISMSIWRAPHQQRVTRPSLTSQSYNSLSCSMIHSSRMSLFRSSFLSYLTVTFPCFFCTGSSPLMGPELTQPTPGAPWKKTRPPAVGRGALVSVLAADIAGMRKLVTGINVLMKWGEGRETAALHNRQGECAAAFKQWLFKAQRRREQRGRSERRKKRWMADNGFGVKLKILFTINKKCIRENSIQMTNIRAGHTVRMNSRTSPGHRQIYFLQGIYIFSLNGLYLRTSANYSGAIKRGGRCLLLYICLPIQMVLVWTDASQRSRIIESLIDFSNSPHTKTQIYYTEWYYKVLAEKANEKTKA